VLDKARLITKSRDRRSQLDFLRVLPRARLRVEVVAHDASTSAIGAMILDFALLCLQIRRRAEVLPVGRRAVSIDCCACLLLSLEATILSVSLLTKLSLGYLQLHVTAILVSARCPMREGLKIPRYHVPSAWADRTGLTC
jgi:hypothetical protein